MTTFLRLQDVIASETRFVDRAADLKADEVTQIRLHINEAIKAHQQDAFWFNQQLWERDTEAGQEFYALPAEYVAGLTVSIATPRRKLRSISNDTMEGWDPGERAMPSHFALFANQYRLYPVPDKVYTIRLWGVRSYEVLVADDDSNAWLQFAFELIREAAKARVFYSMLHDQENAAIAQANAVSARADLAAETRRRQPPQEIRPFL
jgi:hypothetical protein